MSREVMQMALEALDSDNPDIQLRAATSLRQALVDADDISEKRVEEKAKREHDPVCAHGVEKTKCDFCHPKQEPVAWTPQVWRQFRPDGTLEFQKIKRTPNGEWEDYTAPPKRELTCVCGAVWEGEMMVHPPRKREWVGLTHPQIHELDWPDGVSFEDILLFVRAIEQALKEKNT